MTMQQMPAEPSEGAGSPLLETPRREAGFTLLELLIAIALLALLAILMFGILRFGIHAWGSSEGVSTEVDDIAVTRALLRRLISEAYPMLIPDPAQPRIDFAGASDRLTMLAPIPDAIESGGMAHFTLFADAHDGRSELDLAWRPELTREDEASATKNELLLADIAGLDIAYFGSEQPSDPPSWHDRWSAPTVMPKLVRVRVEFPKGDGRFWPDLVVAPRIVVDQSCLYDPVTRHCRGR